MKVNISRVPRGQSNSSTAHNSTSSAPWKPRQGHWHACSRQDDEQCEKAHRITVSCCVLAQPLTVAQFALLVETTENSGVEQSVAVGADDVLNADVSAELAQ